jgi:inorganic triphosphatase YgiF
LIEIELKFQIEPARRDAVRRAVAGSGARAQTVRLQARYFDTPDGRLAAAGLALRLRREGRNRWVQTLKGRGDGLMRRLEHEHVLPPGVPAVLHLAWHDGTPAGAALRAALGPHAAELVERFGTDIRRTRRVVRARSDAGELALVELACDEGWIHATRNGGPQRLAVAEVEFELLSGPPQALLALASRWVQRHGLWLDVRSKAERGHDLAVGGTSAVALAQSPLISRRMTPARALAAMVQAALAHALPNLAVLAETGSAQPEYLHQLRVGLRRLRTALREFGAGVEGVDAAWHTTLAQIFSTLGALRDRDVIAQTLSLPRAAAQQAGLATSTARVLLRGVGAPSALDTAVFRERRLHRLLLALIGLVQAGEQTHSSRLLIDVARKRLTRLHKRVMADAARFAELDDAARHGLRKRLKRLRYSLDFVAPLFAAKAVTRYLALLKPAQEALGDANDVALTKAACLAAGAHNAGDAFVLGWLTARRDALSASAADRLKALAAAPRFWQA